MTSSWCLQCYLFFTLRFLNIVQTVPPEYCLSPFNGSDCNLPPKQVFSYYKPGSRCELETWRGCPTLNLFANEYHCSLNCIFRMRPVEAEPTYVSELKLEDLDVEPLEKLNEILDKYIEDEEDEKDDEEEHEEAKEDEVVPQGATEQVTTEEEPESEESTTAEPVDYTTVDDFDEVALPY